MKRYCKKNKKGIVLGLVIAIAILLSAHTFAMAMDVQIEKKSKYSNSFFRGAEKLPFEIIELGKTRMRFYEEIMHPAVI